MATLPGDAVSPSGTQGYISPRADRPMVGYTGGIAQRAGIGAGEAVGRLGMTGLEAANTIQDTHDKITAAAAEQDFISKKLDLDEQFARDPDYQTAPQRYRTALQQALIQSGAPITGGVQRADFQNRMARWIENGTNEQLRASTKKWGDQGRLDTYAAADKAVDDALRAPDEATRTAIFSAYQTRANLAQQSGWLSPTETLRLKKEVSQGYAAKRATMMADADPDAAVKALQPSGIGADGTPTFDKTNDWRDYLDPAKRMDVIRAAQQRSDAIFSRQLQQDSRDEMLAERRLRESQRGNFAQLDSDRLAGKPIDDTALSTAVRLQKITPEQARFLQQGGGAKDNPEVRAMLQARADRGEDIYDDAIAAGNAHQLTASSVGSLIRASDARSKQVGDEVRRNMWNSVRAAAGAPEGTQFDFSKDGDKAKASLLSQAWDEWTRRVDIGGEKPADVRDDMVLRYSKAQPTDPTLAMPNPRFGQIQSTKDAASVAVKTQQAYDAGQINAQVYQREIRLIQQYNDWWRSEEQRQAAAEQARKTAGVRK